MRGMTIPIILTILALIVAFMTYRGIRRGGTRFYTLEREAILRQANLTLLATVLLFLGAVGYLLYERQQEFELGAAGNGVEEPITATPDAAILTSPPTETPTATPDPAIPTPEPTPVICRAIVDGTAGAGLALRDQPNGERLSVEAEGSILTLIEEDEPVQMGQFTWVKVRTADLREGWVAIEFLRITNPACLD